MDYARLSFYLKVPIPTAQRIWEIFIMSKAFRHPTDTLTADQNQFLAFARESGLPDDASRKYIDGCEQYSASERR